MTTLIRTTLFLCSLASVAITAPAQNSRLITKKLIENMPDWHEGRVTLMDGSKLIGKVRFDENVGILTYQSGDESKTFLAKNVTAFDFLDVQMQTSRFFFSMEYDDGKSVPGYSFFEILKEFDRFALLSKVDPIEIDVQHHNTTPHVTPYSTLPSGGIGYSTTELNQTETIFIVDDRGNILPFVKIMEKESDRLILRKRTRNRFVDKDLLRVYTGSHHTALEEFADANDLDFRIKSDLVQILNYYGELLASQ